LLVLINTTDFPILATCNAAVMPAGVSPYTHTSKTLSFAVADEKELAIKRILNNRFSTFGKQDIIAKF
jgi:hypothetical protein